MSTEPFIDQLGEDSPSLSELLDIRERCVLGKLHTGMVARVVSYDAATQTCNVQPVVRGRFGNGDTFRLPVLPRVPVMFPQGGGFMITWSLVKNDAVWVSFSERSLDEWKAENGTDIEPQDVRRFDLSDAVAYPGLSSPAAPLASASANGMALGEDSPGGLRVQIADGKVTIGTPAVELLALVDTMLTALDTFATATSLAAVEPTLGPAAATLKTSLLAVAASLATIKGP